LMGVQASPTVSSLTIVTVAVDGVPSVAPVGADSATVNVSSASITVSPMTGTLMFLLTSPAAKVRVPEVAVKSLPDVAVPGAVAKLTVTGVAYAAVKGKGKCWRQARACRSAAIQGELLLWPWAHAHARWPRTAPTTAADRLTVRTAILVPELPSAKLIEPDANDRAGVGACRYGGVLVRPELGGASAVVLKHASAPPAGPAACDLPGSQGEADKNQPSSVGALARAEAFKRNARPSGARQAAPSWGTCCMCSGTIRWR
jgi:hypothetical protein